MLFFVLATVRRGREGLVARQENEPQSRYERERELPMLIPISRAARVKVIAFLLMVIQGLSIRKSLSTWKNRQCEF